MRLGLLRRARGVTSNAGRDTDRSLDEFGLSAEDSAVLHSLMAIETVDVNRKRLEFLG